MNDTATTARPTLRNGCTVLDFAPSQDHPNGVVVLAEDGGPSKVVCWIMNPEDGEAFWGAYGRRDAAASFFDRTGRKPDVCRYEDLKDALRAEDLYDAYGAVMGVWFTIAAVLYFERSSREADEALSRWHYSPGGTASEMIEEDEHPIWLDLARRTPTADLVRFGDFLARYREMLGMAGRDY